MVCVLNGVHLGGCTILTGVMDNKGMVARQEIIVYAFYLSICNFCVLLDIRGIKKIKMADPGIQRSTFIVEHYGTIDFSINRKTALQVFRSFRVRIFTS